MEENKCNFDQCTNLASSRCSRCKIVYYCSQEHQKLHWKSHKIVCKDIAAVKENSKINKQLEENNNKINEDVVEDGKKVCRCMFCGEELILGSEDEAVTHMRVCVALQEQLSSKDQFTIPTFLKDKISKK